MDDKGHVKLQQVYNQNFMKYKNTMLSIAGLLGFFLIWQLSIEFGFISSKYLTRFTDVVKLFFVKMYDSSPEGKTLFENIGASLIVAFSGFFLAILIGTPLGLLMGWFKPVEKFVRPVFEIIRPIPPIAWIPLNILLFGIGLTAKAMVIFLAAFIPIVINSYTGIKMTTSPHISVAQTCGATTWQIFFQVGVPSALPMIFTGIRISLGAAWATLAAAEMLAANAGLGFMIWMGRNFARPDVIVLGMLTIGALGALFSMLISVLERALVKWRNN